MPVFEHPHSHVTTRIKRETAKNDLAPTHLFTHYPLLSQLFSIILLYNGQQAVDFASAPGTPPGSL